MHKSESDTALAIGEFVISLRRRLLPPGSLRDRAARALYLPLLERLRLRRRLGGRAPASVTAVFTRYEGLQARARRLPSSPRLLLLKPDNIGDFVVALPAMRHLRERFAGAHITLVCASWNVAWAERTKLFDRVVAFDFFTAASGNWQGGSALGPADFDALNLGTFDLAVDLRHEPDTRPLLARARAMFRAGFCARAGAGGEALDIALPYTEDISAQAGTGTPLHAEERLLMLAQLVASVFVPAPHPASLLLAGVARRIEKPYAVLAPGAGAPIKIWPVERMAEVAAAVARDHALHIVLIGGSGDRDNAARIAALLPEGFVTDLTGTLPLADLPDLIAAARIYIGNDTGSTHLAGALGVPTVSILSGSPDARVWHTHGARAIVLTGRMPCAPCHLTQIAQCPYKLACMAAVTPAHVLAACTDLLAA